MCLFVTSNRRWGEARGKDRNKDRLRHAASPREESESDVFMTQETRSDVCVTLQTETAEFVMHTSESDVSMTQENESSTRCYWKEAKAMCS